MKDLLKNPLVVGIVLALAVAVSDFLNAYLGGGVFSWQALALAGGIAVVGFIGKYLTGSTNTILAMVGSALVAVIPMVTGEEIDWKFIALTFVAKLLGLLTAGMGAAKAKPAE